MPFPLIPLIIGGIILAVGIIAALAASALSQAGKAAKASCAKTGKAGSPKKSCPKPKKKYFLKLKWVPDNGYCGDNTKLIGTTNLPDGEIVDIAFNCKEGIYGNIENFSLTVAGGKIEQPWEIHNVDFTKSASPPPKAPLDSRGNPIPEFISKVNVEASTTRTDVDVNKPLLKVKAMLDAPETSYDSTRGWSGFSNHSHFKQKLVKFRNKVNVELKIVKAWSGYWVNLSSAGITGTAGGCPWAGHRWARGTTNPQAPDEYYDGAAWVPFPAGFTLTGTNHSTAPFYKSGSKYVYCQKGSTATWPEAFTDYNFNSKTYTDRRKLWEDDTHTQWSDVWHLRRKNCNSLSPTRCCRYDVDVKLKFNTVAKWADEVVAVCAGNGRSNAGTWFMDEARISVAAHETGHHMDNPDEYLGGAVDTSLNDDGAVAGIDDSSMMGSSMVTVKKRHYHAFGEGYPTKDGVLKKLIKKQYGREYEYEAVDR